MVAPATTRCSPRPLDPASDRAVFRQIADHLRDAIDSGRLAEGDQLPSEAQMIEHYGVTRMTAWQALGVLKAEGLVIAQHGRGVFVRLRLGSAGSARTGSLAAIANVARPPSPLRSRVREEAHRRPDRGLARNDPPRHRGAHRLPGEAERVVIRQPAVPDRRPPGGVRDLLRPGRNRQGDRDAQENSGPGGIYARLDELGHRLDHFEEEISARMPPPGRSHTASLSRRVSRCSTWSALRRQRGTGRRGLRHGDVVGGFRPRLPPAGSLVPRSACSRRPTCHTHTRLDE